MVTSKTLCWSCTVFSEGQRIYVLITFDQDSQQMFPHWGMLVQFLEEMWRRCWSRPCQSQIAWMQRSWQAMTRHETRQDKTRQDTRRDSNMLWTICGVCRERRGSHSWSCAGEPDGSETGAVITSTLQARALTLPGPKHIERTEIWNYTLVNAGRNRHS